MIRYVGEKTFNDHSQVCQEYIELSFLIRYDKYRVGNSAILLPMISANSSILLAASTLNRLLLERLIFRSMTASKANKIPLR